MSSVLALIEYAFFGILVVAEGSIVAMLWLLYYRIVFTVAPRSGLLSEEGLRSRSRAFVILAIVMTLHLGWWVRS